MLWRCWFRMLFWGVRWALLFLGELFFLSGFLSGFLSWSSLAKNTKEGQQRSISSTMLNLRRCMLIIWPSNRLPHERHKEAMNWEYNEDVYQRSDLRSARYGQLRLDLTMDVVGWDQKLRQLTVVRAQVIREHVNLWWTGAEKTSNGLPPAIYGQAGNHRKALGSKWVGQIDQWETRTHHKPLPPV